MSNFNNSNNTGNNGNFYQNENINDGMIRPQNVNNGMVQSQNVNNVGVIQSQNMNNSMVQQTNVNTGIPYQQPINNGMMQSTINNIGTVQSQSINNNVMQQPNLNNTSMVQPQNFNANTSMMQYTENINGEISSSNGTSKKSKKKIIIIIILILLLLFCLIFGLKFVSDNFFDNKNQVTTDNIVPGLFDITIYSDNENNKSYAEVGDTIYLNFKADEELKKNPVVTINDEKVEVINSGGYYSCRYEVIEQFDNDFLVFFNISDYEDNSGNKGKNVVSTTDGSFVYISAGGKEIEKIKIQSLKFENESVSLVSGTKRELNLIVEPSNAYYENVIFTSDDISVAEVINNELVAKKVGDTKIYATIEDKTAQLNVHVVKNDIAVTGLEFDNPVDTMYVGQTYHFNTIIKPYNATNTDIKWSSSDNNIATVSDGNVLAKNVGKVVITAKLGEFEVKKEITIKKQELKLNKIVLNSNLETLYIGKTFKLMVSVDPLGYSTANIKWSSSNNDVVTVSNSGVVTAKGKGEAIVTASLEGKTATTKFVVVSDKVSVDEIVLSPTSADLNVGDKLAISSTIFPSNATIKDLIWTSSNTDVATVAGGVVTGKSKGTVTITAKSSDSGKTATAVINVVQSVTSISVSPTSKSLNVGESVTLSATVNPSDANDKTLVWSSSNTNVATVSNSGKVVAKAGGTATITVKNPSSGKTAISIITVLVPNVSVTNVSITGGSETIYINDSDNQVQLKAVVSPSNATNNSVTWSSSNTSVAKISSSGVITTVGPGTTTITVKTDDGGKTDTYNITVKKKIAIIIGGTETVTMSTNVSSYKSSNSKFNYKTSDGTLKFFGSEGAGKSYQTSTTTGWKQITNLMEDYSDVKGYVEFFVFFPISGDDVKKVRCTGSVSPADYSTRIDGVKSSGYNVQGIVVSPTPVQSTVTNANTFVVADTHARACETSYGVDYYRSNKKYYTVSISIEDSIENSSTYSTNLIYLDIFSKIMNIGDNVHTFNSEYKYNTIDGIVLDSDTAVMYLNLMLNESDLL